MPKTYFSQVSGRRYTGVEIRPGANSGSATNQLCLWTSHFPSLQKSAFSPVKWGDSLCFRGLKCVGKGGRKAVEVAWKRHGIGNQVRYGFWSQLCHSVVGGPWASDFMSLGFRFWGDKMVLTPQSQRCQETYMNKAHHMIPGPYEGPHSWKLLLLSYFFN